MVQVVPYYSHSNQHLITIHTTFNKTVPILENYVENALAIINFYLSQEDFAITDGIDGFATRYTINYRDIVSDKICSSAVIPASSCEEISCNHMVEISTSLCPPFTVINVTAFATNVLGNGPTSIPRIIG